MYSYMEPRIGPVIAGLDSDEQVVYAESQPQYIPLHAAVGDNRQRRVVSRWTLDAEQRKAIAEGADIFLELLTFGEPLQPIRMAVSDGNVDPNWFRGNVLETPARLPNPQVAQDASVTDQPTAEEQKAQAKLSE